MKLIFSEQAWEDYLYWQKTDAKILERINTLVKETTRQPFTGIGKPEPLKYMESDLWSRRIDLEHRLLYTIENQEIIFVSCRYHYKE